MKKILAALTTAVLAVGLAVVGISAPASAVAATAVQNITSTCSALTVGLSGYADTVAEIPAVPAVYNDFDETVVDSPAVPAVRASQHFEYKWFTLDSHFQFVYVWAQTQPAGYSFAFDLRIVNVPAQAAIPAVTHVVHHHDLVTAEIPAVPAKTNSVVVTIDGGQVASSSFGTTFATATYAYPADFQTHHYSVQVIAWNGTDSYTSGNLASGACSTAPTASIDHLGECYANNGFSSRNVYVSLNNSASEIPVTFTGNGINQTVPAHTTQVGEASPMWNNGGGFNVTAAGKTFPITVDAFTDCGASTTPYVQGPWVGTCTVGAPTRTVEFWFDNTASNRPVEYFVNGVSAGIAPANQKIHYNAPAAPMAGADYLVTAGTRHWTLTVAASDCLLTAAPVAPTVVAPAACGTYASVTAASTPGVTYVTVFNQETGRYKVTATPAYGYKFAGSQSVVYQDNAGKMVKCVVGAKVFSNIIPAACGVVDVWVSNDAVSTATTRGKTGVAKIYVDGVLSDTLRVKAGEVLSHNYSFAEDSSYGTGTIHAITVKVGGTQIADRTVQSDCALNVAAANPHSNIVVNTCGTADVYISNDFTAGYNNAGTAFDAKIYVDGVLDATVTVQPSSAGGFTTNSYAFAEDSGDHVIRVEVNGVNVMEQTAHSDCELNVAAANPHSNIVATCGAADVYISNDFTAGYNNVGTAFDAKIYVDNTLTDTVSVLASAVGEFTTNPYTFAEDSGDHNIRVEVNGAVVMEKTVASDCVANPIPPVVNNTVTPVTNTTANPTARSFAVTTPVVPASTDQLETFAFLQASASATDQVCTSKGKSDSGFITVDFPKSDPESVRYFVGDTELTSHTTEMKPGSYTVTASARELGATVSENSWPLTIAAADCAKLASLTVDTAGNASGFFGSAGMWIALFVLLLLLAGLAFFLIARRRNRQA